ncbi:MAG: hypothetical protein RQ966_06560 [Acetobacteraceae bacterium]|nr:hypothetical protein [Acetobacteraceae bacterium]
MRTFVIAQPSPRTLALQAVRRAALWTVCFALLTGCSRVEEFYDSKLSLDQPVDWWHQLQGGPVADERPPPPGITDPYPNLARVPGKPAATDAATRAGLSAQLATERDHARLLAAQDPLVFPPPGTATLPTAKPAAPGPAAGATPAASAAPQTPDPDTSTMVLDAANATPPAPAVKAPQPAEPGAPAAFRTPPRSAGPVESGPIPAIPASAPPLPKLSGLPTTEPAPVVLRARPSIRFDFPPGSAALPASAEPGLRALAAQRAGGPIAVTAGGDASSAAPDAQGAALPLALRRTGAIAALLIAAGVPSTAIRSQAVAPGREASARLVD